MRIALLFVLLMIVCLAASCEQQLDCTGEGCEESGTISYDTVQDNSSPLQENSSIDVRPAQDFCLTASDCQVFGCGCVNRIWAMDENEFLLSCRLDNASCICNESRCEVKRPQVVEEKVPDMTFCRKSGDCFLSGASGCLSAAWGEYAHRNNISEITWEKFPATKYSCACVKNNCQEVERKIIQDLQNPPDDTPVQSEYDLADLPAPFLVHGESNYAVLWPSDSSGAPCQINLDPLFKSMKAKVYFQDDVQAKREVITGKHLIIIGNACVNELTAELLDNPDPCDDTLDEGKGYVRLVKNGDHANLIIMGKTASDTVRTCTKVGNGESMSGATADVDLSS